MTWDTFRDLKRKEGHTAIVNADASMSMPNNLVRPVGLQIVDGRAVQDFGAGALAIGSDLESLIVRYDGTVNPARSTGPALFAEGGWALGQLWLFWVAPIIGAAIAGIAWKALAETD